MSRCDDSDEQMAEVLREEREDAEKAWEGLNPLQDLSWPWLIGAILLLVVAPITGLVALVYEILS